MVALIVINAPYPFKIEPNKLLNYNHPPLAGRALLLSWAAMNGVNQPLHEISYDDDFPKWHFL